MALSDSMFLVDITVEELRSYVKCKDFIIKSQFADVFSITLRECNEREKAATKQLQNKFSKRKSRWKNVKQSANKQSQKPKVQSGQAILFAKDHENFVSNMKKYPIELSLWSKRFPQYKLASTSIPWRVHCINYISEAQTKTLAPVTAKGEYNVFDEFTSRRMAVVKLNIKLSYLGDKITSQIQYLPEQPSDTFKLAGVDSMPSTLVNTIRNSDCKPSGVLNRNKTDPIEIPRDTGIIKTIYKGGMKKHKKTHRKKIKSTGDNVVQNKESVSVPVSGSQHDIVKIADEVKKSDTVKSSIVSLVKSESDIDKKKQLNVIKSKSCSALNHDQLKNILNYIFGNSTGPFGNQVYCVGYFTVENANKDSPGKSTPASVKSKPPSDKSAPESAKSSNPEGSKTSDKSQDRLFYKFKLCDNTCVTKKIDTGSCDLSLCSIDIPLPQALAEYTDVTKCGKVTCEHKKFRELPTPPDDRILLDLTSLKKDCCDQSADNKDRVEKLETVQGGMKAKMKVGDDPCYCECECRFGFTKKTIYCKVCGGYEAIGDEHGERRPYDMPFPCPIYHKVPEKPKSKPVSITGSDAKKSSKKSDRKSIESEKESKKGKKKKKENKFKFNYGYTGIRKYIYFFLFFFLKLGFLYG